MVFRKKKAAYAVTVAQSAFLPSGDLPKRRKISIIIKKPAESGAKNLVFGWFCIELNGKNNHASDLNVNIRDTATDILWLSGSAYFLPQKSKFADCDQSISLSVGMKYISKAYSLIT